MPIVPLTQAGISMGREINIDTIRALEKQIEEGEGDIIELKRARNSLLDISAHLPPEILGDIFAWCLVRGEGRPDSRRFAGLRKGSYNFLLVRHHWFEVASNTPELWSFWGNTLQDWKKCYDHPGAAPLDLVLDGDESDPSVFFDESLQEAIRSRVVQDTIRQVHLRSEDGDTLTSIISSLTPSDEGCPNDNIESIVCHNEGSTALNISEFFARSRLSRLRFLDLYGQLWISSWDHLAPRTTFLTSLLLDISASPSPTLTTSQLFSTLTSNPNLQELLLSDSAIPDDSDGSTLKVPLRNLKVLTLAGEFRHLFGLLRQLILPETLDQMSLTGSNLTVEDISQILAPYMRDYFRRDVRFQDRLGISSSSNHGHISITVGVVRSQIAPLVLGLPRVLLMALTRMPPLDAQQQFLINLIALTPRERVVSFDASLCIQPPEELFYMMPNIETLRLCDIELLEGFLQPDPDGPLANTKLLPSLRSLFLENIIYQNDDDWSLLTTYLAHQTSEDQAISLMVIGDLPDDCPEVVNGIKDLVEGFTYYRAPGVEEGW